MRTIGFLNWKGGVGKTSIAINTAYALAESWGVRVLFIDQDKQGNASYWFDCDETKGTLSNLLASCTDAEEVYDLAPMTTEEIIQPTRYPNIDLIAGDPQLLEINLAILKNAHGRQDNILSRALEPVRERYDICVIDNPPDSNIPVLNGLNLMDDVVAVTLPNRFSLNGVEHLAQEIKNLGLDIAIRGVIVNQFTSTDGCYAIVEELREKNYRLFPHIRGGKSTQKWLDQAINEQKSIYEISPRSGFARDLMKFIEALVA